MNKEKNVENTSMKLLTISIHQDYIDLNQKYTKLKKHAVRNGFAMCLLINIFNNTENDKQRLFEGIKMLLTAYYKSLIESNQFDDLKEMKNTANNFSQELVNESKGIDKDYYEDFIKKFIKKTNY